MFMRSRPGRGRFLKAIPGADIEFDQPGIGTPASPPSATHVEMLFRRAVLRVETTGTV